MVDKQSNHTGDVHQFTRRELLTMLGSLGLIGSFVSVVRGSLRFLTPPVSQASLSILMAGLPGDFPAGALTPLANAPVFIGRDEAGLFALSAVCTHLGCTIAHSGQGPACPCHGSRFAADGTPLAGPAPRPLPHLALTLNSAGLVEVNLAQAVPAEARLAA